MPVGVTMKQKYSKKKSQDDSWFFHATLCLYVPRRPQVHGII